jgi:transposase
MKAKRTYGTVDVEKLDVAGLLALVTVGCIIAIDVAKTKFVAAIATAAGDLVRLLRFEHPRQTQAFLSVVKAMGEAGLKPRAVMESTGTYGDAIRYQLHRLNVPVHMMSPKHTHDFAEVIDGVPSMHDPKAAVTLARLQAIKPAKVWEPEPDTKREIRALLDLRVPIARVESLYGGLLESTLARHWPELGGLVNVRERKAPKVLLRELPSPALVAAAPEQAATILRKASYGGVARETIDAIVASARTTCGVPMTAREQVKLGEIADCLLRGARELDWYDAQIAELVDADAETKRVAQVVGPACAAAILGYASSPAAFANPRAFEKALGLNLKERSSGEKKGRLSITKRGPGVVRQLLYLAALRFIENDVTIGAWYRSRRAYQRDHKLAAVVAVMRKLARALWHVARGADFDVTRLLDTRRLERATTKTTSTPRRSRVAGKFVKGGASASIG